MDQGATPRDRDRRVGDQTVQPDNPVEGTDAQDTVRGTSRGPSKDQALEAFSPAITRWFLSSFSGPTPIQVKAWAAIGRGEDVLVVAPTGQGKTLAAFLWAIQRLTEGEAADSVKRAPVERGSADVSSNIEHSAPHGPTTEKSAAPGARTSRSSVKDRRESVRVLYISPLKALAADVERNLRRPLAAIAETQRILGQDPVEVTVAMRTGDTPAKERQRLLRHPADILITTPESLYLLLTSKATEVLRGVETVIVDEVHSVAGTKRGAHLALSLERLDDLLEKPAQRIGLSATVRPEEEVARFLGGARPVKVVADHARPAMDLSVRVPVADLTAVPEFLGGPRERGTRTDAFRPGSKDAWKTDRTLKAAMAREGEGAAAPSPGRRESRMGSRSIWPHLEAAILDEVESHGSTIVFVNSRGLCERLCARLNELHNERLGLAPGAMEPEGTFRSDMGSAGNHGQDLPEGADIIARAHHGSVSKERRESIERDLKSGVLRCVVATSSLELGIDMGSVDLVIQVAPPLSVASGLQRVGRANHRVGGRSQGVVYPRTRPEVVDCAVAVEAMGSGAIEATHLVRNPLDVLAQQTVAAAVTADVEVESWWRTVRRAANFADLSRHDFDAVLAMVSGAYGAAGVAGFAPRVTWDHGAGTLSILPAGRRLAISSAGTIPDRGVYPVFMEGEAQAKGRRRVGELDEEMVHESRVGDVIVLGTTSWRITSIGEDRVLVERSQGRASRLPFWHGEGFGRELEDGLAKGRFLADATAALLDGGAMEGSFEERLLRDGLDGNARANLANLLVRQRAATGHVPTASDLVLEYVEAEPGDLRLILHSPFGRRVHGPWALAVSARIERLWGYDPQAMAADDGIVFRLQPTDGKRGLPGREAFVFDEVELVQTVRSRVGETSLFSARFRECAARALLMAPRSFGSRTPLWLQRIQSGQLLEAARTFDRFPMVVEAMRECMEDVYDMEGLRTVMAKIRAGAITLHESHNQAPSPLAAPLLFGYVGEHLYDDDKPHGEKRLAALSVDPALLGELLGTESMEALLDPEVVARVEGRLQHTAEDRRLEGAQGVARLLRELGPLSEEELAARVVDLDGLPVVIRGLIHDHRAFQTVIAGEKRLVDGAEGALLARVLGVEVPQWAAAGSTQGVAAADHPLDVLVARYGRTHGPFSVEAVAARFGIGAALVEESLGRLGAEGTVVHSDFGEDGEGHGRHWVGAEPLRAMRALALAEARAAVEAVSWERFQDHVLRLQGIPEVGSQDDPVDRCADALALYEGVALPAAQWESVILPDRVEGYRPTVLDELLMSQEVVWRGSLGEGKPRGEGRARLVTFHPTDSPFAPVPAGPGPAVVGTGIHPGAPAGSASDDHGAADSTQSVSDDGTAADRFHPTDVSRTQPVAAAWRDPSSDDDGFDGPGDLLALMETMGEATFPQLLDGATMALGTPADGAAMESAMTALLWDGLVMCDRFEGARAVATPAKGAAKGNVPRRRSRSRYGARASAMAAPRVAPPGAGTMKGRWAPAVEPQVSDTEKAVAQVESLLDRYGVVTPALVAQEGVPGMWGWVYPVLKAMEDSGALMRGTFVEGLEPLQFASADTVDGLRAQDEGAGPGPLRVVAASDPANLLGTVIPWPEGPATDAQAPKPQRKADGHAPASAAPASDAQALVSAAPATDAQAPVSAPQAPKPQRKADGHAPASAAPASDAQALVSAAPASDAQTPVSAPQAPKPQRKADALVAFLGGRPVLHSAPRMAQLLTIGTTDLAVLTNAVRAVLTRVLADAAREGRSVAREKILVERVDGLPVGETPLAEVLKSLGFVRTTNGFRYYANPF